MKNSILLIVLLVSVLCGFGQATISGTVYGQEKQKKTPLVGANIYWLNTTLGTTTNDQGEFNLSFPKFADTKLVISFIGYQTDTIAISENQTKVSPVLSISQDLDEVTVTERQRGEYISKIKPLQTQTITEKGLQKLPCCNLSESFENSATVDVGFSDAVTGAKQIKMLGLAGKYSQIMIEKKPNFRGLSTGFGLMYIPGSWMQAIQISKGTSSVVDGFESISGQINVEYKKPENANPLHVNLYANAEGKMEANILAAQRINEKWSTMLLLSGSYLGTKHDKNKDGFLDLPLTDQVHVFNRWKYQNGNHQFQAGFSVLDEKRNGGQMDFTDSEQLSADGNYGFGIDTRKYEAYFKNGYAFKSDHYHSLAIIGSAVYHEMNSFFGVKSYNATQRSLYTNLIHHTELWNESHTLTSGLTLLYDDFEELYETIDLGREEIVPGVYSEYNFSNGHEMNIILGLRYDHSSIYGGYLTPRLHSKYHLGERSIVRLSGGRGHRVANVIAENTGLLASSRNMVFLEELDPEDAWNAGINFTHDFSYGEDKELALSVDYYRTQFVSQVMVDMDQDKHSVYFYNLDGTSFSNSFQLEASSEVFEGFDITAAFRINDVQVTLNNTLQEKPYVNRLKGLISTSYATKFDKWTFDLTAQYNGQSRLPDVSQNMNLADADLYSPVYYILHGQITRKFKHFSVYLGGENLTDFVQKNPIIDPENPFGENFDASRVWGPILGRTLFIGVRFDIDK